MTQREHAGTTQEDRGTAGHPARAGQSAVPAGLAGLRTLPAEAQLRAAAGLQGGVSNRALARAALAREPAPLPAHADSANTPVSGEAFVKATGDVGDIDANDVKQGLLGDCNLLAPAAAVARANPEAIRRLISKNADGTYDVTLYYENHPWSDATPHTFRVTSQFYTDKGGTPVYAKQGDTGASGPELWVMLIEKAFARMRGSYSRADGALWDREGLELLTGNSASEYDVDDGTESELLTKLSDALKSKQAVTVNTSTSRWKDWRRSSDEEAEITKHNIKLSHAYSIEAVDTGAKTVSLRNPWGFAHLTSLPVSVFRKYFHTWSRVATW